MILCQKLFCVSNAVSVQRELFPIAHNDFTESQLLHVSAVEDGPNGRGKEGGMIFYLAQSIDHALEIMAKAVPIIELREDEDTIYVTEPDILYAEEEGRIVIVTLKDGRTVKVATTAINLFSQIENHPVRSHRWYPHPHEAR